MGSGSHEGCGMSVPLAGAAVSHTEARLERRDPNRRRHRGFFDCARLAARLDRQDAGEPVLELHDDRRGSST